MPISLYQTPFVGQGSYEEVVSKLLPLRYHVGDIGGSRAQEDVVHLTLVDAASRIPDQACVCTRSMITQHRGPGDKTFLTLCFRYDLTRDDSTQRDYL